MTTSGRVLTSARRGCRVVDLIGAGSVGAALQRRAEARGVAGRLHGRGAWALTPGAPVVVCTRNDDLEAVVAAVPANRREDLVFVQNGMVRPALASLGVAGTRGLLFLAVAARGDDVAAGGVSPLCGPRAEEVAAWLRRLDVSAAAVEDAAFRALELEKLMWICVHGVVCEARSCSVGDAAGGDDVRRLTAELLPFAQAALGTGEALEGLLDRMDAYSRSIPDWRATLKEWRWRNGWFVEEAASRGVALPEHEALLRLAGRSSSGDPLPGRS